MNKRPDNFPFYGWLPRPLGVLILLFLFIPPTFSGGAYLSNLSEMSGGLGVWAEDIQMASFFTSIGMCLFPPFMLRFLQARRVKQTYLYSFLLLIPLNYVCAVTTSVPVLLAACLMTGFVRVMVMLNCTFTIAPYLTGMDTLAMFTLTVELSPEKQYEVERKRTLLMPLLYGYILLISQCSNMVTAWFAYVYHWQTAYYAVIGLLFLGLLLVFFTMPNEEKSSTYQPEWAMVPDLLLMAVALCSLTFVLIYGKTLDWWDAVSIRWALVLCLLSCAAFIWRASKARAHYYLPLEVFSFRNVWMAMLLFMLTMLLNAANSFIGTFAKLTTPINNLQSAALSGWAIVGCVCGLLLSLVLVKGRLRFRWAFFVAFLLMAAANAWMYFQFQTMGLFRNMAVPMVLHFTGLLMLYSLVAAFGMKHLPARYLVTFVFLMIWMRNAIAPVVGASCYANWLNQRQQYYIARLAQEVDAQNPLSASAFRQTQLIGQAGGKSALEAEQLSVAALKSRVGLQATLVALKEITGHTVLLLMGAAGLSLLLPYYKEETM